MHKPSKTFFNVTPMFGESSIFKERGWAELQAPEHADFLIFSGGADVDPTRYHEENTHSYVSANSQQRDSREFAIAEHYLGKKNMLGICRGMQLLNVVAGGSLVQDIRSHPGVHAVMDKWGAYHNVNSAHHQLCIPAGKEGEDYEIILWADISSHWEGLPRGDNAKSKVTGNVEPEALYYPKLGIYGIQGHPEFGHSETNALFFSHINRFWGV